MIQTSLRHSVSLSCASNCCCFHSFRELRCWSDVNCWSWIVVYYRLYSNVYMLNMPPSECLSVVEVETLESVNTYLSWYSKERISAWYLCWILIQMFSIVGFHSLYCGEIASSTKTRYYLLSFFSLNHLWLLVHWKTVMFIANQ